MKLQFLGTAAAEGFPSLYCMCEACKEAMSKGGRNIRSRCQALLDDTILLDFGPDTYYHMIMYKVPLESIHHILITHNHFDHIGAVGYIVEKCGCDVYIHKNDAEFLTNTYLNLSDRFGSEIVYNGRYFSVNEQHLSLLGLDFKFIHTPGHTPGSVCIRVGDCLFTGDTLFKRSVGNAFSPYGDTDLEILSIKNKVLNLDDRLLCYPGHGESTSIEYEKHFNPYLV